MSDIWMGLAPEPKGTRVIAMAGPSETILKARLLPSPQHPRAMATLLEAVAMWQGTRVRAVLSVADWDGGCGSNFYPGAFTDFGGPLYTLDWVPACPRGRRHRDLPGVGSFADLRQQVLFEVAR
ncbi:MAG TPA: hypothetical protein VK762_17960 [Polyangiaceae bacterium]|jgi:hypothetical protein|nr:hypothetical protein [Polyangiaceae bacterium]